MADTSKGASEKAGIAASKRSKKRGANLLQYYLSGALAIGVCLLAAALTIFGRPEDFEDSDDPGLKPEPVPSQIASIIDGFDFDRDGRISIDEIHMLGADALKDEKQRALFAGWKQGFHEADIDGDGYLTAFEVRDLVNKVAMSSMAERFRAASDNEGEGDAYDEEESEASTETEEEEEGAEVSAETEE